MHELFKKAVKGRRFNDSEAEFLQKIISDLRDYFLMHSLLARH